MLLIATAGVACMPPRYYDVEYHDYHRWDEPETVLYLRWETETHRDHQDFGRRKEDEQREYWSWRHKHGDDRH
jgi:hypothetical protein